MHPANSPKSVVNTSKTEFTQWFRDPNTRYAMIGIIGALVISCFVFLGLKAIENEPIETFIARWEQAVESKDMARYRALWDSDAIRENRANYERALKFVMQEAVEADITNVQHTRAPESRDRYQVKNIPATFGADDKIPIYRHLTVEKKGLRRQWKLIDDEITSDESLVADSGTQPAREQSSSVNLVNSIPENPIEQMQEPDISMPFEGTAPLDTKLKVNQILFAWQEAWQDKDLETYMSMYADEAEITRVAVKNSQEYPITLTKSELRKRMKILNRKYSKIEVLISNVKINGNTAEADVGFLQKFTATPASGNRPPYSDYGTKHLILMVDPTDGVWRIYSERWKLYKDVPEYPKL